MGRKRDTRILLGAAEDWLNELETEIVPGVQTKEERKSYGKQARVLRGALMRRLHERELKEKAATAQSAEPLPFGPSPADGLTL